MAGRAADGGFGQTVTNRRGQERVRMANGRTRAPGGALATTGSRQLDVRRRRAGRNRGAAGGSRDVWTRAGARAGADRMAAAQRAAAGAPGAARAARRATRNARIRAAARANVPNARRVARREGLRLRG